MNEDRVLGPAEELGARLSCFLRYELGNYHRRLLEWLDGLDALFHASGDYVAALVDDRGESYALIKSQELLSHAGRHFDSSHLPGQHFSAARKHQDAKDQHGRARESGALHHDEEEVAKHHGPDDQHDQTVNQH